MFNPSGYNGNNNNGNSNNGDKKKSNFKVGRIYGSDGILEVGVWNSDRGGTYAQMSIKAAIGKDPSTGMNAYEQKMSGELPTISMNAELLRALIEYLKTTPIEQYSCDLDTTRGAKINITGSANDVKITITNQKTGTRTVTLEATPVSNSKRINANMLNLIDYLQICYKHAKFVKLDNDEFGKVIASEGSGDTSADGEEAPF